MPRIVACLMCSKLERIPDVPDSTPRVPATVSWDDHGVERDYTFRYEDGSTIMVPEFDPLLEDVVYRHGHSRPDTEGMQFIKVFPVDQATYDKMDVVTELKRELASLTDKLWEEVEHYKTEALKCYNEHHNPTSCIDYLDDSKRIGSDQMPRKYQSFLCHMCPIQQAYISHEQRKRSGLYDPASASVQHTQKQQIARNKRTHRRLQRGQ
jgi:hypothetical protein